MATEQNSVTAETDRGLKVIPRDHGQFEIRNTHPPVRDWDREYVCVSGYFGPHSPEMFAAAPEMAGIIRRLYDQLRELNGDLEDGERVEELNFAGYLRLVEDARAILAKVGA